MKKRYEIKNDVHIIERIKNNNNKTKSFRDSNRLKNPYNKLNIQLSSKSNLTKNLIISNNRKSNIYIHKNFIKIILEKGIIALI